MNEVTSNYLRGFAALYFILSLVTMITLTFFENKLGIYISNLIAGAVIFLGALIGYVCYPKQITET